MNILIISCIDWCIVFSGEKIKDKLSGPEFKNVCFIF